MKLDIQLNTDQQTLYAELIDAEASAPVTPEAIQMALARQGYGTLKIDPQAISQVVTKANTGKPGKVALCTLRDAEVQIDIASDHRTAYIRVNAANGGRALTSDQLQQAIAAAKIPQELIDRDALMDCLSGSDVARRVLAHARLPVDGQDARYTVLVECEQIAPPTIAADGTADLLNTHEFVIVEPGTPLMRRQPATPGEAGLDVTGKVIKPKPGVDPGFASQLPGAALALDDGNLLVATLRGHPVIVKQGVKVDAVLHLPAVDVKTGHLHYDGSVEIAGDIAPGMQVEVSGDLVVKGSVERAQLKIGHDLRVSGGIFGTLDAHHDHAQQGSSDAVHPHIHPASGAHRDVPVELQVGGSLQARFINQAQLQVGQDVVVREYISNSRVSAGQRLLLGQQGGKGVLMGGFCHALLGAELNQLGNDSYLATHIKLGDVDSLRVEQAAVQREKATREQEASQLGAILDRIKSLGSPQTLGQVTLDKARKIGNTIKAIEQRLQALTQRLADIDTRIAEQTPVRLVVRKAVHPGVVLNINGAQKTFNDLTGTSQWVCVDDQIFHAP